MAINTDNLETVLNSKIASATASTPDKDLLLISKSVEALDNSTSLQPADIGSTVQAFDATIVVDADIGTTVQAYDATIVVDADIGVTVQAFDATIVVDADIGTTVQAYDATIVVDADIGTTVQAFDATIVVDADIGTTVQAFDADTTKNDIANTFTAEQTFIEFTETVYTLTGTVIDPANGGIQTITLTAATTYTESLTTGQSVVLMISGGVTNAITWPSPITWVTSAGNVAPTITDSATIVIWKVGSTLYGAYVGSYV